MTRSAHRTAPLQAFALGVAVIAALLTVLKLGVARGDALPAPARSNSVAIDVTSVSPAQPMVGAAVQGMSKLGGGLDTRPRQEPIDRAVAPDGGVPTQPDPGLYRSPFAESNGVQPVRVKVGLLLNSVDDYDIKTGRFLADFFLSLTSDEAMPALRLSFPNGKVAGDELIADKPTFKLYRLNGEFKAPPDLRKYPFDTQNLKIMIEDDFRGVDQVRLVVDEQRTQLARGFRALGWQVNSVDARSTSQSYADRFENDDLIYGRYTFELALERYATSAAFTVFVPAFVIVLISLIGMWVPPSQMEVRSNAGAPMLAAAVLFHFALMQELPGTSYLTRADKLMLGVYVSLLLGIASTWWMFLVEEEHIHKVFVIARTVVPVLSVGTMAAACLI